LLLARGGVERSLLAGKSVVTANKQLIAHAGADLMALAGRQGCQLRFEAAVAGGIPVIGALQDGLAGDRLFRILGILNGTCNYILTRMEIARLPFSQALREAQERGYAEADPSADIDGFDAQAKLAILCAVGLGRLVRVSDIGCRSISAIDPIDFIYADRLGCVIRQISWAEEQEESPEALRASVQPVLVPRASPLARIQGSQNMVVVFGEFGGETAFSGHGAGGNPTAVAVVSDLLAVARSQGGSLVRFPPAGTCTRVESDFVTPQYVRFTVRDRPGIIAALAEGLSARGINIDAVLQEPGFPKSSLPFVVTLEPCGGAALQSALRHIEALDFHVQPPVCLPMLILENAEFGMRNAE
jgi:homoserine dehydrogenase